LDLRSNWRNYSLYPCQIGSLYNPVLFRFNIFIMLVLKISFTPISSTLLPRIETCVFSSVHSSSIDVLEIALKMLNLHSTCCNSLIGGEYIPFLSKTARSQNGLVIGRYVFRMTFDYVYHFPNVLRDASNLFEATSRLLRFVRNVDQVIFVCGVFDVRLRLECIRS